jgi:hypothetical protein
VEVGDVVSPGSPIFQIVDMGRCMSRCTFPSPTLRNSGDAADVFVDAIPGAASQHESQNLRPGGIHAGGSDHQDAAHHGGVEGSRAAKARPAAASVIRNRGNAMM